MELVVAPSYTLALRPTRLIVTVPILPFDCVRSATVTVGYQTNQGTRTYQVETVAHISSTDYSYLNEMGDNRITLITCIANQPSLRLCVQAIEIR